MEQENDNLKKPKQAINNYVKYSSIAVQMMLIIGLGTLLGYKMDEWLNMKIPLFKLVFILLSVGLSLYSVIRSLK